MIYQDEKQGICDSIRHLLKQKDFCGVSSLTIDFLATGPEGCNEDFVTCLFGYFEAVLIWEPDDYVAKVNILDSVAKVFETVVRTISPHNPAQLFAYSRCMYLATRIAQFTDAGHYKCVQSGVKPLTVHPDAKWPGLFAEYPRILPVQESFQLFTEYMKVLTFQGDREVEFTTEQQNKAYQSLNQYLIRNEAFQTSLLLTQIHHQEQATQLREMDHELLANSEAAASFKVVSELAFTKCVDVEHADYKLALAYICSLPTKRTFAIFKEHTDTLSISYSALNCLAELGTVVGVVKQLPLMKANCERSIVNTKWWSRLHDLGISFEADRFVSDHQTELRDYLQAIIRNGSQNLKIALEFARDYMIHDDIVLQMYLREILGTSLAIYIEDVKLKASMILPQVANAEETYRVLEDIHANTGPYDYERLQCINELQQTLDSSQQLSAKRLQLIHHLHPYRRITQPSTVELIEAASFMKQHHPLTQETREQLLILWPSSTTRLPLHQLINSWTKVLFHELTYDTIQSLIPLAAVLNVKPDYLYVGAIRNLQAKIVVPEEGDSVDPVSWMDYRSLLTNIKEVEITIQACVIISNNQHSSLTNKTSAWRYASQLLDKSNNYMAIESYNKQSTALVTAAQARKAVCVLDTEAQLRALHLNPYLIYCTNPEQLIRKLYDDWAAQSYMDIKSQPFSLDQECMQIAKRNDLDLSALKIRLLDQWISSPSILNTHHKLLPSAQLVDDGPVQLYEDRLQQRILYILSTINASEGAPLLSNISNHIKRSILERLRAARALQRWSKLSGDVSDYLDCDLYAMLRKLLYQMDFDQLRIALPDLNEQNVTGIAQSLWTVHHSKLEVVHSIANMCIDYSTNEQTIWSNILRTLLDAKKVKSINTEVFAY